MSAEARRPECPRRRSTGSVGTEAQQQALGATALPPSPLGRRVPKLPPKPTRNPGHWWSPLERNRLEDPPILPEALAAAKVRLEEVSPEEAGEFFAEPIPQEVASHYETFKELRPVHIVPDEGGGEAQTRPLCIGLISACDGVAASGTNNVILGLRAFLDRPEHKGSRLLAIRHYVNGNEFDIESKDVGHFLNQGGSDLFPTLPLMRVSPRMLDQFPKMCENLELDGLLFLCGSTEMAQVVQIADHFAKVQSKTTVVAVMHSLSGWIRVPGWMPTNLGFDSAVAVVAEVAGNIALSRSSLTFDLYHFSCLGSSPLTLEVALQIRPTLCYIGADVKHRGLTLQGICDEICDVIVARHHEHGLHSGEIMISDDFLSELVEMHELREEIHRIRVEKPWEMRTVEGAREMLGSRLGSFFELLPPEIRHDLIFLTGLDGMPKLNAQEVERQLGSMVEQNLARRRQRGERSVDNFAHFPRSTKHLAVCPMPTPLDCQLGNALGHTAGALLANKANGYVASVRDVLPLPRQWKTCGLPMVRFLEAGKKDEKPKVRKRKLTDCLACKLFHRVRDQWRFRLSYRQPGPLQFWGPGSKLNAWKTYTLRAQYGGPDEFEEDVKEFSGVDKVFTVPLRAPFSTFTLVRRREALLSPLQRWRCSYRSQLPEVLKGNFKIFEDDRKGRVCADPTLLSNAFPSLWRTDNLKNVLIHSAPEEVNVLTMLPERSSNSITRIDSWSGLSFVSGGSAGQERPRAGSGEASGGGLSDPSDTMEDAGLGPNFDFELKRSNLRIGVAVVGRAGPGMNNVIQGIYDFLKPLDGTVVCITMGIAGLVGCHSFELTEELLRPHLNQGGCDLLGQSQPEDLQHANDLPACAATARKLELDGLVVWGGRNVHSWTAKLAEHFVANQVPTRVIGVPASVESDLPLIEQTLGHDTVCKLFASIIGDLATQAASNGQQWCFVRIPGRSISHIAAEVALLTIPHVVLVSSDMNPEEMGLSEVTKKICDVIEARNREDLNYGVIIIPDQFMAAVREMQQLFDLVQNVREACPEALEGVERSVGRDFGDFVSLLPPISRSLFESLPEQIRAQICLAKGEGVPKGAVDLTGVETEVIFRQLVTVELTRRVVNGTYKGPLQCRTYSLPYHGRATMPTNFDCNLGYTIGYAAAILVDGGRTGLLVHVSKLKEEVKDWEVGGIPLSSLLSFREAKPGQRPTFEIRPRGRLTYDLGSEQTMPDPCKRTLVNPGPAQYEGPCANITTQTLCMPQLQRVRQMALTDRLITDLKAQASAGCPPEVLEAVRMLLQGGVDLLRIAGNRD